jgi:hypothetical protein
MRMAQLQAEHPLTQLLLSRLMRPALMLAGKQLPVIAGAADYAATACLTGRLLFLMPVMAAGKTQNSSIIMHTCGQHLLHSVALASTLHAPNTCKLYCRSARFVSRENLTSREGPAAWAAPSRMDARCSDAAPPAPVSRVPAPPSDPVAHRPCSLGC